MVFNKLKLLGIGSVVAFCSILNVVNAEVVEEKSRAFFGVQAGSSWFRIRHVGWGFDTVNQVRVSAENSYNYTYANYGILGGYELWFMDYLGLRLYANYTLMGYASIMQFGGGADVIWNFMNVGGGNLGIFGGFQAMGVYFSGSWVGIASNNGRNWGFDMAANIGVRWSLDNHVVEIFGKIPFIESKTYENYMDGEVFQQRFTRELFALNLRYVYRF
ncbi:outer membrane beta-barrel protein [Helicobacter saguini]|uniref:Outer membrane beta-barrel protein n=1 Tax=Helicobacter saguini TaxID=1548018 RepID=A0A099B826_9HELI|nr:outer membrane beta-barrel protein [Helicobacter saguini]MWV63193.1 outer membrane beta-barrel protein [Helicobacter saguini]MWV66137.1 outer membrane beta-barrel protein [Helicobacter saguini]MWV68487.1 outer membrane beta-barrel protein [Helicobacter saguini]MWV71959.1 outer membrane beta-barrel protein [Helicobacter saguini]TLD95967.1 outer membrane beta-barrel protein [Helicobacter saguini]